MPPTSRQQVTKTTVRLLVLAIAAGGTVTASAWASRPVPDVHAYKPVADTYVTAAAPRTNYGRARMLVIDGAPETTTYLRFRLDDLERDPERVTLLLHSSGSARTPYAVRAVRDDDWTERRLTYANAPRLSLRYTASRPVRRGLWSVVDVTPFVVDDEVNLAITTRSPRAASFGSRESRYGPRLAVQVSADDEQRLESLLGRLRRK